MSEHLFGRVSADGTDYRMLVGRLTIVVMYLVCDRWTPEKERVAWRPIQQNNGKS
jgi:hypothetical protein